MWAQVAADPHTDGIERGRHRFTGDYVLKFTVYLRRDSGNRLTSYAPHQDLMAKGNVGK